MSLPIRKRYCIFGCAELGASMHRFPHPERKAEMYRQWQNIVGSKIKETDPSKIYKNKLICDFHFTPEQKLGTHRLTHSAIPTLFLNGVFLTPITSIDLEHNYSMPRRSAQCELDDRQKNMLGLCEQPTTSFNSKNFSKGRHRSHEHEQKLKKSSQKKIRKMEAQIRKAKKTELSYKARLDKAYETLSKCNNLENITKNMTNAGRIFTGMQYKQALKKPKGRRYTTEEKVLALSIYKRSRKCYVHLAKYFKLPSAKCLKSLLSQIKVTPGINKIIFEKLRENVQELKIEDRLCTLIFDEMALTPHIQYVASSDELKGFVTEGEGLKIADHALVFMVKGVKANYKQPVAYYFTQCIKAAELKKIIKDVIRYIHTTGLKVLCTVCDQGSCNTGAINSLIADTKQQYLKRGDEWRHTLFEVDANKIIPIYDVPHLLKGLRNNLLTKDLKYTDLGDNQEKLVKWRYFEMLYEADKSRGELRYLHKLTEEHIYPHKIKKMRVKMASQVFSHSAAIATDHLTTIGALPPECRQLIPLVLLIDKVFDSLNAGTFHIPNGKIYRGCVKINSPHHKLWQEAKKFFRSMKFVCIKKIGNKVKIMETSVPSIKNFIITIEGMEQIWKILHENFHVDCMLTRHFNQDPVENFFGNIRSLGVRNTSPNCISFEGSFKTLLLNNFTSKQSINANCEEDFNKCINNLQFMLKDRDKLVDKIRESTQINISEGLCSALLCPTSVNDIQSEG